MSKLYIIPTCDILVQVIYNIFIRLRHAVEANWALRVCLALSIPVWLIGYACDLGIRPSDICNHIHILPYRKSCHACRMLPVHTPCHAAAPLHCWPNKGVCHLLCCFWVLHRSLQLMMLHLSAADTEEFGCIHEGASGPGLQWESTWLRSQTKDFC